MQLQLLIIAIVLVILCVWIYFAYRSVIPSQVSLQRGFVIKKYAFRKEAIKLDDVVEIKCHFTAAVGFDADWIFLLRNGEKYFVNHKVKGTGQLLDDLASVLEGFDLNEFDEKNDGFGMVDLWKRPGA